jgi:hypothetical protein
MFTATATGRQGTTMCSHMLLQLCKTLHKTVIIKKLGKRSGNSHWWAGTENQMFTCL